MSSPSDSANVDLRILGRTLLHATLVGVAAGVACSTFSIAVELLQTLLLHELAGYQPLRAAGEPAVATGSHAFRPWLIVVLPAIGAGIAGWIAHRFAPEALGGGGNAAIEAFHKRDAIIRRRVPFIKGVASILTLGTGGAGGREGPTMQIGGGTASLVARALGAKRRERRILYVAGIAAGVAAVFRTPLGAALFAAEVLYRDDFESDALVPAVLASVVSYSTATLFSSSSPLFAHAAHYPFVPTQLPYFIVLALGEVALAIAFVRGLALVRSFSARLPGPAWLRPAAGGLALGLLCAPLLAWLGSRIGHQGQGFGILGGGYGAAQVAIVGAPWLDAGWRGVEVLLLLCGVKLIAASLTIGSGGSAGDFAPSLVLGGLFGGAFGRALALLTGDPRIDAGAFALVGMGVMFGGVAHVPLSSMVLVCELAGSYELIVPLMLAEGIAFVALRGWSLYPAEVASRERAERDASLSEVFVRDVMRVDEAIVTFRTSTPAKELLERPGSASWQAVFPVLDDRSALVGLITASSLRVLAGEHDLESWALASDLMESPSSTRPDEAVVDALARMVRAGMRQLPVLDSSGTILGFLDEASVARRLLLDERPSVPAEETTLSKRALMTPDDASR